MCEKFQEINTINTLTPGIAWQKCVNLVYKNGNSIKDGSDNLKEVLNVFISIKSPLVSDKILDQFSDPKIINWMENNFLKETPILDWGYNYGQRLFNYNGLNQIKEIIKKLQKNPNSKSATVTLTDPNNDKNHTPCIVSLDFKIRNNKLLTSAFFRSQDVGKKIYADIISIGKISQIISDKLKIPNGGLNLFIVSLHLYQQDEINIKKLLYDSSN